MAKEVRWTTQSIDTFRKVVEYLEREWSEAEGESFANITDQTIDYISKYPLMFRETSKENVREALVTPQNFLIYKIYATHINLILFWDTRQSPRKKKY